MLAEPCRDPEGVLLTIGPSHYCEKARWALDLAGVAYEERAHLPIIHWLATGRRGRTVPMWLGTQTLTDSTDIVAFANERMTGDARLIPSDSSLARDALELEDRLDETLGPEARRLAYCVLVEHPDAFRETFRPALGGLERLALRPLTRALVPMMKKAFRTSPRAAARCEAKVRAVFDDMAERLAGGDGYLVGDHFTVADLTFAALATPVLLPDGAGFPFLSLDALPDDFRALVESLRATPAGAHALSMFARHRRPS